MRMNGENNYKYPSCGAKTIGQLEVIFLAKHQARLTLVIAFPYSLAIAPSHEIQSAHNEDRPWLIPDV